jgi:Flp pilus assembly protein CpaB
MKKKSNALLMIGALSFLLGAALVVGALRGGTDAKASGKVGSTVLVAKSAIPAGTTGDVAIQHGLVVARDVKPADRAGDALSSTADLAGRTLDVAVAPGEQLRASLLRPPTLRAASIKIPEGKQGVAVQLPFVAGGAGYVAAGDHVNIYGNLTKDEATPVTKLVLGNVQVLDVSSEVAPRVAGNEDRATGTTVTYLLALDPNEAEQVIYLAANAQVWMALVGTEAPLPPTSGRRAADFGA